MQYDFLISCANKPIFESSWLHRITLFYYIAFPKPTIEIRKSKPNDSHVNNFNSFIFLWCETSHKRDEKFISMPMIKLCRFEHNLILRLEMFQRLFVFFFLWIWCWPPVSMQLTAIEMSFLLLSIKLILPTMVKGEF